jgi:type I restriction enzyme, S subunit
MELKPGYKLTEVGVIPEDWEVFSVQQLVEKQIIGKPLDGNHGNIHPKSSDYVGYGIPFVMANNFTHGQVDLLSCKFITKERADKLQKGFSISGDVLLTHKGTVGNTAIVGELNTDYIMLTPQVTYYRITNDRCLNNRFLRHYFDSQPFQSLFINLAGGGTRAYLGIVKQLALPVITPPLSEQRSIATALSDMDELLGGLDRLITKKRDLKQSAMQQLLTGKTRLLKFGKGKGYKQTELGLIPEDWEIKKLDTVANYKNGVAHEQNINESGKFIVVNSKFISTEGLVRKYSDDCFCSTAIDDVLMVMSDVPNGRAIAKCFLVNSDNTFTINQRICVLSPCNVNGKLLFYKLDRNPFYLAFDDGAKQTNLRRSDVLSCPLVLPTLVDEQNAIASILSDMDTEIATLEQRRNKTRDLKQAMMQELLTGRIRLL